MSSISLIQPDRDLFSWPQYWAACFGPAPFLPMSREEMDQLGWGIAATSFWLLATRMSITQASGWRFAVVCWKRRAFV